jgi:hypothetical protein
MIVRVVYVRCDGCGQPCGNADDLRVTAAEARQLARRRGWVRQPRDVTSQRPAGADWCPACALMVDSGLLV